MISHANNVSMTVSGTPGTGTITLGSASSGARSFASAYGANATVDVFITDGTAWEVARNCTYTHSGTTLSRGTLESSSTGSAVSLTSAAVVRVAATANWGNRLERLLQGITPGGRLTLESGVPVSTTDQTAKTTIYYTPFVHNTILLWDGADWVPTTFTETSLALGTLTSALPYDVFGYLSSGALVLESLAWTNGTTRATAVTLQDGRYCKSGDKTRLLLGTFYTTSTTATADSELTRYVSNVYNRVLKRLISPITSTYSHTYTTATWREWNNGTGVTRPQWVSAMAADIATFGFVANMSAAAAQINGYLNVQVDGTDGTARLSATNFLDYGQNVVVTANMPSTQIAAGKHYAALIEYGNSGTTYYSADILGAVLC